MPDLVRTVQRNREKLKLVGYFLVMGILAAPLALTLGSAWERAHLARLPIMFLSVYLSIPLQQVASAGLGFFFGLLALVVYDPKKRVQGVLLAVGSGIALLGLQSMDLLLPNIRFVASSPWIVGGLLGGVVVGGGRQVTRFQTAKALEFRRAAKALFYVLTFLIVVALFEYHVQYPRLVTVTRGGFRLAAVSNPSVSIVQQNLARNLVLSGGVVLTLRKFIEYDADRDFFVLGPRGSGKSLFLIGAFLEALDEAESRDSATPPNPTNDLMEMVGQVNTGGSEWIVDATARGDTKNLSFQYIHGNIFPKNIRLTALDYAGEYLTRLPDALTGLLENENDQTLLRLAQNVEAADTLILVIDVERFANEEPLEISDYFSILQATDDKDVVLVATKADILAEEFRDSHGVEAYQYFDDFRDFVYERLKRNQEVRALIEETVGARPHPVYYQTKEAETGDGRVPRRDADNSVMTVGFDELLDRLGR